MAKKIIFQTTFSRYVGSEIVGEGGAGRVYAVQDESGEAFAIKALDPKKATRDKIKRFRNELEFCNRCSHPNIVDVVDHGLLPAEPEPVPFYVMPRYASSLRDLMKKGISPNDALKLFAQILDGVEAAHLQKVIHRDLKPENILYAANDHRLVVADFGIAHFEEEALYTAVETAPNQRLANFQYSAPEQRNRGGPVSLACDIYALGLMLNELFTGDVPGGTNYKQVKQTAPDHAYVDRLVSSMLEQSPSARPQSIDAVKQTLIGYRNEFVERQKLDALKNQVVPESEVNDSLISDPIKIVDFDWDGNTLTLVFQRGVNATWIQSLRGIGDYTSLQGKGPNNFNIGGDRATIDARENQVQQIIHYFKTWLPKANQSYADAVDRAKRKEVAAQRAELERQVEQQEARLRLKNSIKI